MTTTKQDYVSKTFNIREDTADLVEQLAEKLDVSQAAVLRYIVTEYFKEPKAYGMGIDNPQMIFPNKENN